MTDFKGKKCVVGGLNGVEAVDLTGYDLVQRDKDHQTWLVRKDAPPLRTLADEIADLKAESAALQKKLGVSLTKEEITVERSNLQRVISR